MRVRLAWAVLNAKDVAPGEGACDGKRDSRGDWGDKGDWGGKDEKSPALVKA